MNFVLNDVPCGSERTYNGLCLAGALARQQDNAARVFLIGDGARRSTLDELSIWTVWADKVLVF